MASFILYIFVLHGDARSHNFLVAGSIFILLPNAEKNHLNIVTFCFCRLRELNLGRQSSKPARYPLHLSPSAIQLVLILHIIFTYRWELLYRWRHHSTCGTDSGNGTESRQVGLCHQGPVSCPRNYLLKVFDKC